MNQFNKFLEINIQSPICGLLYAYHKQLDKEKNHMKHHDTITF